MELLLENNSRIWFDGSLLKEQEAVQCFDIQFWEKRNAVTGSAQGRGTTWFVKTPILPAALRHYFRGGLLSKVVDDRYLFTGWQRTRAQEEFALLGYLYKKGIAVPRPLAARAVRQGLCYQADILVEKIDGARDLVDVLKDAPLSMSQNHKIGQLIRKLHDAGVSHSDLNIRNILLDNAGKFWLIDFDKCSLRIGKGGKEANLRRLQRSFRKEKELNGILWQESDWQSILRGYVAIR